MTNALNALLLAMKLLSAPVDGGAHVAESICSAHHAADGDTWWECVVALETYRCERQGWCSEPEETAPYQAAALMALPDPARPGQSYVTGGARNYEQF